MRATTTTRGLAAVSALTLIGLGGANASIVTATASGGSEAVLTVINNGNNATLTQDLGAQLGDINPGTIFALSNATLSFIGSAGGLANVSFSVIAGNATARTYLTSTADADLYSVEIANSERNVWAGTLNNLIPTLNSGDPTATSVNTTYGPLPTGTDGNYLDGGFDLWNGAYVTNTGAGNSDLLLYKLVFGTSNLQNAVISSFFANPADSFARLVTGPSSYLQIGNAVVPVPAAAWLFGSALGLLGIARRRA